MPDVIPSNMKLFAQYMLGSNSPITEEDFTKEELQLMRSQILRQQAKNQENEDKWRNQVAGMDQDDPNFEMASKKLRSYEDTKDRTALDAYDDVDWDNESVLSSFSDPAYNLATTLGSYSAHQTPEGLVVKDKYDWGDTDTSKLSMGDKVKAILTADSVRQAGNAIARTFRDSHSRPVEIKLEEEDY